MIYNKILITGGSGKLGSVLLASGLGNRNILAPTRAEMDITNKAQVIEYFSKNQIDAVIHCAAYTNVRGCEENPDVAIKSNVIGTANVVEAALKQNPRFIYLSTDYVYPCSHGPYSEKDKTIPFTSYGWSKLGGECTVKLLKNHCIIRTSLFNPQNISFDTAPIDAFYSKISFSELAKAIKILLDKEFIGTVNIGQERASAYEILSKYKPEIRPVSIKDIPGFDRAVDSSLDITLWKSIRGVVEN
jgi:dTDP-4-dehydrorhamnose reductase